MVTEKPDTLREWLARIDHGRSNSIMSNPAYHGTWEELRPDIREVYLGRQDWVLTVFGEWLRRYADRFDLLAAATDASNEATAAANVINQLADVVDKELDAG